jgi:hypothetical protein
MHEPLAKALLPKHECERGTIPQGNLNEGNGKPSWPLQAPSHEDIMSASEGPAVRPGPWNPGGKSPRKQNLKLQRPVEAMYIVPGINEHNKMSQRDRHPQIKTRTWPLKVSVGQHHHEKPATHLVPYPPSSHPVAKESICFCFKAQ